MTDLRAPDGASPTTNTPKPERKTGSGLFRAAWRWHFFASFLAVPILLLLATTGLIYLFRFQIEPLVNADLMRIGDPPTDQVAQPYAAQLGAVERAYPDNTLVSMTEPRQPDASTVFSTVTANGEPQDIFVNPYGAEVLGSLNPDNTISGIASRLHGEMMVGRLGDAVIELGACWAIVMALTGYYLFFKGWRARRRARRRGTAQAKLRSRHGLIGSVVGVGLLFLLVSGLPWTGIWGAKVQELATSQGSSLWSTDPGAVSDPTSTLDESLPHSHGSAIPWGAGKSEVPRSEPTEGERSVANVDTAVAVADAEGLRHPMTVILPGDEGGVFSVIGYAFDAPSDEQTVHIDQYGAEIVSSYGYDDYPALAKVVSQGIGLHEGRSFGLWSFWGAALMCALVIASCITGPLMWWRRRPKRASSIGAPRGKMPLRATPLLAAAVIALGIFLPLFGISLLVALLLDQLVLRRVPRLAGWFDVR